MNINAYRFSMNFLKLFLLGFLYSSVYAQTTVAPQIFVQSGHTGQILCLDKTPDDRFIISGSQDATLKLWDVASGKEIRTFNGHQSGVTHVAISTDGKTIISSATKDSNLIIWQSEAGTKQATIRLPGEVTGLSVLPGWRQFIVSVGHNDAYLYDIPTAKMIRRFPNTGSILNCSADGQLAVSRIWDNRNVLLTEMAGKLHVWETNTGKTLWLLDSSNALAAALTLDKSRVVSGELNNIVKLWDLRSGKKIRTIGTESEPGVFAGEESDEAVSVAFSQDGKKIISGHILSGYTVWDVASGIEMRHLITSDYSDQKTDASQLNFLRAGRGFFLKSGAMIAGVAGSRIYIWNAQSPVPVQRCEGTTKDYISGIRLTPDMRSLMWISSGKGVHFFDLQTGRSEPTMFQANSDILSVTMSDNGQYAIITDHMQNAVLWDIHQRKKINSFKTEAAFSALSDDGSIAISAVENQFAAYSTKNGSLMSQWDSPHIAWSDIAFLPGTTHVVIGFYRTPYAPHEGLLRVWDTQNGKPVLELYSEAGTPRSLDVSRDGKIIFSGHEDNTLKMWDSRTGKLIRTFDTPKPLVFLKPYEGITGAAMSPDGLWVVAGSADGSLNIWQTSDGKLRHTLQGHTGTIRSAYFSPDSKKVFTGGADGSLRMWDVESGREYAAFHAVNDEDWVTMTREGYFTAGGKGAQKINVAIGNQVFTIDNFFETYFRPDVVQAKLEGRDLSSIGISGDLLKGIKTPPTVTLSLLRNNGLYVPITSSEEKDFDIRSGVIKIKATAEDAGGGIGGIRLFNNGKAVGENIRGFKAAAQNKKIELDFSVTLTEGENKISAIGMSDDNSESNPVNVLITYRQPALVKPDMHILATGINQYRNAKYNLNYCVGDAQGFVNAITPKAKKIFSNIHTTLLLDREANRAGVLAALTAIQRAAKPEDVLIIFYAGHGMAMDVEDNGQSRNEFFYILSEVTQMSDPIKCAEEGISGTEMRKILSEIKATKQVMFVDACNSGAFAQQFAVRGAAEENALAKLSRASGSVIYASTKKEQFATELAALKHGAFTYVLIDALGGQAGLPNGQLTVSSIKAYVDDKIPEITKKYKGEEQYPTIFIWGQDFPIGMK